jgi:caa(3)-type oxidase subunit IV
MSDNKHTSDHDEHEHFLQPISVYIKVFIGLIILTGLTVLTSMFDFGIMNIVIAMLIALAKSTLVVFFFMQLKYDNIGDKVTFAAAFVFLAVFILLTSSDLFFRRHVEALKVVNVMAPVGETDQNKLRLGGPALIAKGKTIFQVQCISCHGPDGFGNGGAAAALNPKPRNFHVPSAQWHYGTAPTVIFHTLTNGSPGTGMASYSNLSVEDRYALVAFVRSLNPDPAADTPQTLKNAGLVAGSPPPPKEIQPLPIEMAMDKIEVPDELIMPSDKPMMHADSPGAKIYGEKCIACHGMNGSGGQVQINEGQDPRVSPMTRSWAGVHADWVSSQGAFVDLVSKHFPGSDLVGTANFSRDEWKQIYSYSKELTHND